MVGNVAAASGLLVNVDTILRSIVSSHGLSRSRILRRSEEGIGAHACHYHHECDDRGDQMLTNDFEQIHQSDAVIRFLNYPLRCGRLLHISVLYRSH